MGAGRRKRLPGRQRRPLARLARLFTLDERVSLFSPEFPPNAASRADDQPG